MHTTTLSLLLTSFVGMPVNDWPDEENQPKETLIPTSTARPDRHAVNAAFPVLTVPDMVARTVRYQKVSSIPTTPFSGLKPQGLTPKGIDLGQPAKTDFGRGGILGFPQSPL